MVSNEAGDDIEANYEYSLSHDKMYGFFILEIMRNMGKLPKFIF